jgi:hypothetical protein
MEKVFEFFIMKTPTMRLPKKYIYGTPVAVGKIKETGTTHWNSPSNSMARYLNFDYAGITRNGFGKNQGFSVRCIRD